MQYPSYTYRRILTYRGGLLLAAACALLAGCGGPPDEQAIRTRVETDLSSKPYSIATIESLASSQADGSFMVAFKGTAKLDQALYGVGTTKPTDLVDIGALVADLKPDLEYLTRQEGEAIHASVRELAESIRGVQVLEPQAEQGAQAPFAGTVVARKTDYGWSWSQFKIEEPAFQGMPESELKPVEAGSGQVAVGTKAYDDLKSTLADKAQEIRRSAAKLKEAKIAEWYAEVRAIEAFVASTQRIDGSYHGYRSGSFIGELSYDPASRKLVIELTHPDNPALRGTLSGELKRPEEMRDNQALVLQYEGTPVTGASYPFAIERARFHVSARGGTLRGVIGGGSEDEFILRNAAGASGSTRSR